MNDISSEGDVRELVEAFYGKLVTDPVVGHFFKDIDLEHHLPRIRAFWEMVLLDKPGYSTNVTDVHLKLDRRIPMARAHFDRWLALFDETIGERFNGPKAEEARLRARSIAAVLLVKIGRT